LPAERTRVRRIALAVMLVLIGGCGAATVWRVTSGLRARRARAERRERLKNAPVITPVETHEVYCRSVDLTVDAVGDVTPYRTVTISAEVAGRLTSVRFDAGDTVQANQLLATIDRAALDLAVAEMEARLAAARANQDKLKSLTRPQEKDAAAAAVARAKAILDEAETQFTRDKRLFDQSVIGKAEYEASTARLRTAEADYRNARERLLLLEAGARAEDIQAAAAQVRQLEAQRDAAKDRASKTDVVAPPPLPRPNTDHPINELWAVAHKRAEAGQYVQPGTAIASLIETDHVKVVLHVPEMDVSRLRLRMPARVLIDAYPGDAFGGKVTSIAPRGDPGTKTFKIEVTVPNPAERLRPQMTARVQILVQHLTDQMVVPTNAVANRDASALVFVARDGSVEEHRVEIVRQVENEFVIRGDLRCGDRVITLGREVLTPASQIRVVRTYDAPRGAAPRPTTRTTD